MSISSITEYSRTPSHNDYPSSSNSRCPTPTPIFQQLCLAVSHWEQVLADSPDFIKEKYRRLSLKAAKKFKYGVHEEAGYDTGDEESGVENGSDKLKLGAVKRSNSMIPLNCDKDDETNKTLSKKIRRKSIGSTPKRDRSDLEAKMR